MSEGKTNKGCIGCFGAFIFFIALAFAFSLQRESISATSPDGKLTAQVTEPSLFAELFLSDENRKIQLELIENGTGKRIIVEKESSGGLIGDDVNPIALVWHRDNQRFAYVSEISPRFGWPRVEVYRVQLIPLKAHQMDDTWLKSTISLNMKSQDKTTRQQAEKLFQFMREYYKERS